MTVALSIEQDFEGDIDALCEARHSNPFAFLGLHPNQDGQLQCRVFAPEAKSVAMIDPNSGRVIHKMKKLDPRGFYFIQTRRKNRFRYALKIATENAIVQCLDPYQFSEVISEKQIQQFEQGVCYQLDELFGANIVEHEGVSGVCFSVWAPNASHVSVVGDFNHWDGRRHSMRLRYEIGAWEIFIPNIELGQRYKFELKDRHGNLLPLKADPFAKQGELRPGNASLVVHEKAYTWNDHTWINQRAKYQKASSPMSIYQVHLGSWRRKSDGRFSNYRELAHELVDYVSDLGFTHIQLLPISEYPFDGSWGYQPTGLFAVTSRFKTDGKNVVEDFQYFVDYCHQHQIGVLIDWVPAHFPSDDHGLKQFDGTCLFEHKDPRRGFHPDWNTLIYNFGRKEVSQILIASALRWLDKFHVDGIRVDAVASMLYLNYSRKEGEWLPNIYGGHENLEAIDFLKRFNREVKQHFPDCITIAEESSAWPDVTTINHLDGLGFDFKWNMGWMNDTLQYMKRDPIHREYHANEITFGIDYAFNERFILALSHDEVVHEKGTLLTRMPGDDWQRFANLRAYFAFMWSHPGKKMLFMGAELATENEWDFDSELDWSLLNSTRNGQVQSLIRDLNKLYSNSPALYRTDHRADGFEWIQTNDSGSSIFAFIRQESSVDCERPSELLVIVCNFTPQVHHQYSIRVPCAGFYREILNTDADCYGGSHQGNMGGINSTHINDEPLENRIVITVPPLATCLFRWEEK